jgi:hypothetical protein
MFYILWLSPKKDLQSVNTVFLILVCILGGGSADDELWSPTTLVWIIVSNFVTGIQYIGSCILEGVEHVRVVLPC